MRNEAPNDTPASPNSTEMIPFGLPWLWRQCWAAGLMLVAVWIVTAIIGQFNGGTIICSSWASSFGFILGMTSQMWVQQRFE